MSWTTTKSNLTLSIQINWDKYNNQNYTLPPQELGICKKWRFEKTGDNSAKFWAMWELRQINKNIKLSNILEKMENFIVN